MCDSEITKERLRFDPSLNHILHKSNFLVRVIINHSRKLPAVFSQFQVESCAGSLGLNTIAILNIYELHI